MAVGEKRFAADSGRRCKPIVRENSKRRRNAGLKLLPGLMQSQRTEALWFLAKAQTEQGRNPATLERLARECPDGHPLAFESLFLRGHLLEHRLGQWNL